MNDDDTLGNGNGDSPRETLVAARRQPVKVIIHNPDVKRPSLAFTMVNSNHHKPDSVNQLDSFPTHPLKRGRIISSGRPSLDFEKMREVSNHFVQIVILKKDRNNNVRNC